MGLTSKSCKENMASLALLTQAEVDLYKNQAPGWRVATNAAGQQCIKQDWKGKDADAAPQIAAKLTAVSTAEGHSENVNVAIVGTELSIELTTTSFGGCDCRPQRVCAHAHVHAHAVPCTLGGIYACMRDAAHVTSLAWAMQSNRRCCPARMALPAQRVHAIDREASAAARGGLHIHALPCHALAVPLPCRWLDRERLYRRCQDERGARGGPGGQEEAALLGVT